MHCLLSKGWRSSASPLSQPLRLALQAASAPVACLTVAASF
jgi:hypothetical protein